MNKIFLNDGSETIVGDEHYDWLNQYKWSPHPWGYAQTEINGQKVLMHRLIMGAKKGQEVDHVDRNPRNNLPNNLRFCTGTQNQGNTKVRKDNTTGYRGVQFDNRIICANKFRACLAGKTIGYFDTAEKAARARDDAAKFHFGEEFVILNFPEIKIAPSR
jgi:hypothetical protein